jgi:flagellar capping protein FliD
MTMDQLMTAMSATGTDVTATYDRDLDRVFMKSSASGTAYDWTGTDAAGTTFLTDSLKVMNDDSIAARGTNAIVNYDGAELTIKDNTFDADGATYYLKGVSTSDVVVTIGVDTDKIVDNVTSFIEAYNTLVTKVNGELKEERYKVPGNKYQYFMPLTDDQKKDMSEEEIKIWEAKARSGLLRSNPILRNVISTFRNDVASPVSVATTSGPVASMNTGSNSDGGTLVFDTPLYYRVGGTPAGELTELSDGTDVSSMIQYTGTGSLTSAIYHVNGDRSYIQFVTSSPAVDDEFKLKTGGVNNLYNEDGELYTPKSIYYKEGVWKYPKTESTYNSASSIGITTGQGDYSYYQEDGKLYLDEDTLRAAIAADPEVVKRIFGSDGDTSSTMGIAQRLYASANNSISQLAREAGVPGSVITNSALDTQLDEYYTEMEKIQERMETEQDRYYNMFNAMESALQRMNAQSSWLAQQTGQSSSSG